jgi:hypothetical protein
MLDLIPYRAFIMLLNSKQEKTGPNFLEFTAISLLMCSDP